MNRKKMSTNKTWNEFRKFTGVLNDPDDFWGCVTKGEWYDSSQAITTAIYWAYREMGLEDSKINELEEKTIPEQIMFLNQRGHEVLSGHVIKMRYEAGEIK